MLDKESGEINLKVFLPADKIVAQQKKNEEKTRMENELIKAISLEEEAKKEKKNDSMEMTRGRKKSK